MLVFVGCGIASAYEGGNGCDGWRGQYKNACVQHPAYPDVKDYEQFDWGGYLNLIVLETPNSEWGVLGTYATETNETRAYAGGKIYLNRMTWQKKK